MKKNLRKPENWQDFESLCKKLFGEIWKCENIKKNGRLGNPQKGVDIYGIPEGKDKYWGIQCKGKDDYAEKELSEKEIEKEIKNALKFEPKLEMFIFATTANKNATIEEFIRKKNIIYKKKRELGIDIYSWEDLVDLIEENKKTFDWYVRERQYKTIFDFDVIVNNDKSCIIEPKFKEETIIYEPENEKISVFGQLLKTIPISIVGKVSPIFENRKFNRSWCRLDIQMKNTGNETIENWNIEFEFLDKVKEIRTTLEEYDLYLERNYYIENMKIYYKSNPNDPLVQKDFRSFTVFVHLEAAKTKIRIKWQLFARNFDRNGIYEIQVKPIFFRNETLIETNNKKLLKQKRKIIVNEFIEEENNGNL